MVKVITYGTYDLLHYGHIRLLQRAKELGDYLIVGVTADDFDKKRGKINVQQSLMERVASVRATGLADEIIVEEYEGQKIDDIQRHDVDIFTVGSDWIGKFDYLNEYCKVVYLDRTEGVSSSKIRQQNRGIRFGLLGDSFFLNKVIKESIAVNGVQITAICTNCPQKIDVHEDRAEIFTSNFCNLLQKVDAVYIRSAPEQHYEHIKLALNSKKHVLCESPLTLCIQEAKELFALAREKNVVLMEAIKTAYATAFQRMMLLIKAGEIGQVVSVDATCTSLRHARSLDNTEWNGIFEWGPTALLPIFQILGTEYNEKSIIARFEDESCQYDNFAKIAFIYDTAVASAKVGNGVKSEGELIVSGTQGYVYVPAPWWKTDYFEIRYEDPANNRRYFYQLEGEGIRHELVAFARAIEQSRQGGNIAEKITCEITSVMGSFANRENMIVISSK